MTVGNIRKLEQRFLADSTITADEAKQLIDSAKDWFHVSSAEKNELRAIVERNRDKMEPAALQMIEKFVGVAPQPPQPPVNVDVVRSLTGSNPSSFEDDTIFLGRDGTVHGDTNVPAYTRGYDATKEGILRFAHGSKAPQTSVLSAEELSALRSKTPGAALDAMASVYGVNVKGFDKMANSRDFFNPEADHWWGKCHAWAWASLDARVNKMVDVGGPEGQRGVWLGGEWISRADLGNWMMAVADKISLHDGNEMFDSTITPTDLVKGTTQFMMAEGEGVVADVFNDKKHGHKEVWNQPFVAADLTTKTLSGDAVAKVLEQAKADGVTTGVGVKQVTIKGTYGMETTDGHESEGGRRTRNWNIYAVVDANGKMLTGYMADDEKLKDIEGLPTKYTDETPEYFWKPKLQAIDDVLNGRRNSTVERDQHGEEFKFFVGTVLTKGVPGHVRSEFEAELAALPAGNVDGAKAEELARKYANVANGYSPAQWASAFGSRGLDARAFGASWPQ